MSNGALIVLFNPWNIFRSKPQGKNDVEVTLQRQKRAVGCGKNEKEFWSSDTRMNMSTCPLKP